MASLPGHIGHRWLEAWRVVQGEEEGLATARQRNEKQEAAPGAQRLVHGRPCDHCLCTLAAEQTRIAARIEQLHNILADLI